MEIYDKRQTRPVMISFAKSLAATYEIPFPAVTICSETKASKKKFDFSKLSTQNLTLEEKIKLNALRQVCDLSEFKNDDKPIEGIKDVISQLEQLSPQMMFNRCSYGSQKLFDCKKLFYKVVTDEGICFTFNMLDEKDLFNNGAIDNSIKLPQHGQKSDWFLDKDYESLKLKVYPNRVVGSGIQSGLAFELKIKKSELNPGCKRGIQGFRLQLHTPVELPHMSKQFYSIPLQKETTIAVRPHSIYSSKDVQEYDPMSRQCFFNHEKSLKFFNVYSKSSCALECLSNFTFASCGCVKFSIPRDNVTKVCDNRGLECVHDTEVKFSTQHLEKKLLKKQLKKDLKQGKISKNSDEFKKLEQSERCNCLPSCTSLRYDAEISQTDFMVDRDEE